jgi:hypothetical protein
VSDIGWSIGAALSLTVLLRYLALRFSDGAIRADQWFWRMYCDTVRQDRRFPPHLPQYVLDVQQWYPPVFPLLWSALPSRWALSAERWAALGIDLVRAVALLSATALVTGSPAALLVAGLVYASTPILVSYNVQLNPRGLGALWLDLLVLILVVGSPRQGLLAWLLVGLLCGLVLLTHKMSTQLLWFLAFGLGIARDVRFLLLIPVSVLAALALSGGFYRKVAIAHWDIVSFWHRNWPWLQAHPIKESPVYGEPGYESSMKFYQRGLKGFRRHLRYLGGYAPSTWLLIPVVLLRIEPFYAGDTLLETVTWWWGFVMIFAVATVFFRPLRSLGSGYFYLYNAAFPSALLWALAWRRSGPHWAVVVMLAIGLGANVLAVLVYYRQFSGQAAEGGDLEQALEYLRSQPSGVVMCIPPQLYDLVAYRTAQPVLFGGHGYGFKMLEPTFPRLLVPIADLLDKYHVRYLLARTDGLPSALVGSLSEHQVRAFERYLVFVFGPTVRHEEVSVHSAL